MNVALEIPDFFYYQTQNRFSCSYITLILHRLPRTIGISLKSGLSRTPKGNPSCFL